MSFTMLVSVSFAVWDFLTGGDFEFQRACRWDPTLECLKCPCAICSTQWLGICQSSSLAIAKRLKNIQDC